MTVVVCIAVAISFSNAELHDIRAQALGTLFYCANWVLIVAEGQLLRDGRPPVAVPAHVVARDRGAVLPRASRSCASLARRAIVGGRCARRRWRWSARSRRRYGWRMLVSPTRRSVARVPRERFARDGSARRRRARRPRGRRSRRGRRWLHDCGRRPGAPVVSRSPAPSCSRASSLTMRVANDHTLLAVPRRLSRGSRSCAACSSSVVVVLPQSFADARCSGTLVAGRDRAALVLAVPVALAGARVHHADVRARTASRCSWCGSWSRSCWPRSRSGWSSGRSASARSRAARAAGARSRSTRRSVVVVIALVDTVAAPGRAPAEHARGRERSARLRNAQRVDLFGDSTALVFGLGGAPTRAGARTQRRRRRPRLGCGVVLDDHVSEGRVLPDPAEQCDGWQARWPAVLRDDPDAAIALMTGAWDILDHRTRDGIVRFGTPEWTALVTDSLARGAEHADRDGPDRVPLRGALLRRGRSRRSRCPNATIRGGSRR